MDLLFKAELTLTFTSCFGECTAMISHTGFRCVCRVLRRYGALMDATSLKRRECQRANAVYRVCLEPLN